MFAPTELKNSVLILVQVRWEQTHYLVVVHFLSEGAIALSVTLSGGVLFGS